MLGKKFFVNSSAPMSNIRFTIGENEYMFSLRDENYYEIRRLSNTFNANVIFFHNGGPYLKTFCANSVKRIRIVDQSCG